MSWRYASIGALLGAVAAIVMAMFALIAAATYQSTGFFTPLYHIASSVLDPSTMMRSMQAAGDGDTFVFSAGPAVVGLALHLLTGASGARFSACSSRPAGWVASSACSPASSTGSP